MFEDICLACGKHLHDDGSAYCSEECRTIDATSPAISSASSALSSPHIDFAVGGEVPALVPSALGYAFSNYYSHDHYSVSSSSASSTSWSVVTDDEDEATGVGSDQELESGAEGSAKSLKNMYHMHQSGMSFARRPSGTNNRSTVPRLHRRTSSGSFSGHGVPQSAPIHSHSPAEEMQARFGARPDDLPSETDAYGTINGPDNGKSSTTKPKRSRNRASLPAYFSLLQMSTSSMGAQSSLSSSSGQTIPLARPSPPTPKLSLAELTTSEFVKSSLGPAQCIAANNATRGRRKDVGTIALDSSPSRSTSHSSRARSGQRRKHSGASKESPYDKSPDLTTPVILPRQRVGSKASAEQVFDWSSLPGVPPARGRAAVRRNSSPPPKVALSLMSLGFHGPSPMDSGLDISATPERKPRGRVHVAELDGVGCLEEAPGYGHGRSGLLDRAQAGRYRI